MTNPLSTNSPATNPLSKDAPATVALMDWWQSLANDKGTRATLRRCKTPRAVMLHPAYARLHHQVAAHLRGRGNWELQLARVVGLLSHTTGQTTNSARTLAKQMGGKQPVVSELRFQRLLQCNANDLYDRMTRIVQMLGENVYLPDLIESMFFWNDRTKRRWAMEYFATVPSKKTA